MTVQTLALWLGYVMSVPLVLGVLGLAIWLSLQTVVFIAERLKIWKVITAAILQVMRYKDLENGGKLPRTPTEFREWYFESGISRCLQESKCGTGLHGYASYISPETIKMAENDYEKGYRRLEHRKTDREVKE